MDWRDRFKNRFKQLKRERRLTQEALAEKINVSQGTVANWLNGRRNPESLEMYEKLAHALNIHPAWLLYGIGGEEPISTEAAEFAREWEQLGPAERTAFKAAIKAYTKATECQQS